MWNLSIILVRKVEVSMTTRGHAHRDLSPHRYSAHWRFEWTPRGEPSSYPTIIAEAAKREDELAGRKEAESGCKLKWARIQSRGVSEFESVDFR